MNLGLIVVALLLVSYSICVREDNTIEAGKHRDCPYFVRLTTILLDENINLMTASLGGTPISNRWIVTSARRLATYEFDTLAIYVYACEIKDINFVHPIAIGNFWIFHPRLKPAEVTLNVVSIHEYDIALVLCDRAVDDSDLMKPVKNTMPARQFQGIFMLSCVGIIELRVSNSQIFTRYIEFHAERLYIEGLPDYQVAFIINLGYDIITPSIYGGSVMSSGRLFGIVSSFQVTGWNSRREMKVIIVVSVIERFVPWINSVTGPIL